MVVCFCFTVRILDNEHHLSTYIEMIKKAIECAKQYHKVKFYTDKETINLILLEDVEVHIVDTSSFYFVDDFKIYLLDIIEDNEVIIDTDLFLFAPLNLEGEYDLYVDFKDNSSKYWYSECLDWFIDNGIKKLFPNFNDKVIPVPNIGVLKFKNKELQKKYTEAYYMLKEWVLFKDKDVDRGVSIILGQYLLGMLMPGYSVKYCYKSKNNYAHLSGPIKFEKNIINNIIPSKTPRLI
jgi:hypothetical protein